MAFDRGIPGVDIETGRTDDRAEDDHALLVEKIEAVRQRRPL